MDKPIYEFDDDDFENISSGLDEAIERFQEAVIKFSERCEAISKQVNEAVSEALSKIDWEKLDMVESEEEELTDGEYEEIDFGLAEDDSEEAE